MAVRRWVIERLVLNQLLTGGANRALPQKTVQAKTSAPTKTTQAAGLPPSDEGPPSISREALKLLEEKRVQQEEKIQKALDEAGEKRAQIQEMEKQSKQSAAAKRLGELKARLKQLVAMMRQALMFGDKRLAALIAKEAAQIAREIAHTVKEAGQGAGGDTSSMPVVSEAGDGEGSGEAADGSEASDAADAANSANSSEAAKTAAADAESAAREAEIASKGQGQTDEANDANYADRDRDGDRDRPTPPGQKQAANAALSALAALASSASSVSSSPDKTAAAQKIEGRGADGALLSEKDKTEIVAYLRAIVSMAKSIVKSKSTGPLGQTGQSSQSGESGGAAKSTFERDVDKAEAEIEDAIREIAG